MIDDLPSVSVIVPVLDGRSTLGRCLDAIGRSDVAVLEVIVADDGSTDGSGDLAARHGARVLSIPEGPVGPARARNRASAVAAGELLVFVDADVVVEPATIRLLVEPLHQNPELVACVGSYDDAPSARNPTSLYTNLRHHFIHQKSGGKVPGFWAGCGAVRHAAFSTVGGFDSSYERPSIEDIELGARLTHAGGAILLQPMARAKHLKRWTPTSLWRTDIQQRAIPWARLISTGTGLPHSLNASTDQRVAAVAAVLAVGFGVLGMVLGWPSVLAAGACLAIWLVVNLPFLALLHRRGGVRTLIVGAGLHFLYFLYSSLVFAWTLTQRRWTFSSARMSLP